MPVYCVMLNMLEILPYLRDVGMLSGRRFYKTDKFPCEMKRVSLGNLKPRRLQRRGSSLNCIYNSEGATTPITAGITDSTSDVDETATEEEQGEMMYFNRITEDMLC